MKETRYIPRSYPIPVIGDKRDAVVTLLSHWLEVSPASLPGYISGNPVTVKMMRRFADLLDVSSTGMATVLGADRTSVSRRMLGKALPDDTIIKMWAKRLIRLGLFCGYYVAVHDSATLAMARKEFDLLCKDPEPENYVRVAMRMKHEGAPVQEYRAKARQYLSGLWAREENLVAAREQGIPVMSEKPAVVAAVAYPRLFNDPLSPKVEQLLTGLGARKVSGLDFSRHERNADGILVSAGDNRGAVFEDCVFTKFSFRGDYSGATFLRCRFDDSYFGDEKTRLVDAQFINCSGSVQFDPPAEAGAWMARIRFVSTNLLVPSCYYNMPGAVLVDSSLESSGLFLAMEPRGEWDGTLATLPNKSPVTRQMLRPVSERVAAFAGVRLINSFIDLPAAYYGQALEQSMTADEYDAWMALVQDCPEGWELDKLGKCAIARGLMGDDPEGE